MRNVIKFNGRLYAMLEEGCYTIQGEIIEVAERSQAPEVSMIYAMNMESQRNKRLLKQIEELKSQPDSRDEMLLKMREALNYLYYERINGLGQTVNEIVSVTAQLKAYEALALPLPATTLRLEAMHGLEKAVRENVCFVECDCLHCENIKPFLANLDSLGGGK